MKNAIYNLFLILFAGSLFACGGSDKSASESADVWNQETEEVANDPMNNKGIGPITSVVLGALDEALVAQGQAVFNAKCTACHKPNKRHIGPSPQGILERRSAEWVMNMILNPDQMVNEDPIAKELLVEYNGSPMANQNLTEEEARSVLEYFRTL